MVVCQFPDILDTVDKKLKAFFATAKKKTPEQREKEMQEIRRVLSIEMNFFCFVLNMFFMVISSF